MIEVDELTDYLDEYLEEKQEVKNLTEETIKKQTFNISKFIEFLEDSGIDELNDKNVKKQLRQYRRHCLKQRGNKRTTVKTYMMNILEFINSEDVQEEIQHETIKMKDIIEVKTEDPETAKKRIEKSFLTRQISKFQSMRRDFMSFLKTLMSSLMFICVQKQQKENPRTVQHSLHMTPL